MARSDATAMTGARASSTRHLPLTVPANGRRRWRQQYFRSPLPDRSVIELNGDGVRRVDGAEIIALDPDPGCRCEPIRPTAGGLTGFVQEVEFGPILGDEGGIADETAAACLDAPVRPGQIDGLRRCRRCENGGHGTNGQCNRFHKITPRSGRSAQSDRCKLVRQPCRPIDLHQATDRP